MEDSVYAVEAAVQDSHWWFVGRRRLLMRSLETGAPDRSAAVLDVGAGTGTNLRLLKALGFSNVLAVDRSREAIRWCAAKELGKVIQAEATGLPFRDNSFDVVLATDIIEHLDDDERGIAEIRRVLRPGGKAMITVPAFPSLWGLQDTVSHHKRRYRAPGLSAKLTEAGFTVLEMFHFNYLLFLPIWSARQAIRLLDLRLDSENQVNFSLMNRLLTGVFALDVATSPMLKPPFGVSLYALLTKS